MEDRPEGLHYPCGKCHEYHDENENCKPQKVTDYKAVVEALERELVADKNYYHNGEMCSMAEAIHGEHAAEENLKRLERLKKKYTKET